MRQTIFATPDDQLQEIFDKAGEGDTIRLAEGIYRQKAVIRVPGLTIVGDGAEKTRIVWNDYARKLDPLGREYNTFRTYTLAVCADGVTMEGLAVVNDAGCPERKGQEIALSVVASDFTMTDCRISSTQDTLFVGPLPPDLIQRYDGFLPDLLRRGGQMRQRFNACRIEGTVDFLFGSGAAVFHRCELRSVWDRRGTGYVAAPSHSPEQTQGLWFRECRFTCGPEVPDESVFLARPWRDYGLARFENCHYGRHIHPLGFDRWNDTRRDLTARFQEMPEVPGRVSWVNRG